MEQAVVGVGFERRGAGRDVRCGAERDLDVRDLGAAADADLGCGVDLPCLRAGERHEHLDDRRLGAGQHADGVAHDTMAGLASGFGVDDEDRLGELAGDADRRRRRVAKAVLSAATLSFVGAAPASACASPPSSGMTFSALESGRTSASAMPSCFDSSLR